MPGGGAKGGGGSGGSGSGGGSNVPTDGWPKTKIDASALGLADAEIALVADSVDLGDLAIGKTRVLMTLTNDSALSSRCANCAPMTGWSQASSC